MPQNILRNCQVPKPMLFATDPAVSRWLGVVNAMLYGPESSKVGEDRFQVIVREVAEITPRHDGGERPGTHASASNDFNELLLIKVGDARRMASPSPNPDWLFEVKHDGFRGLCYIEDGAVKLVSRRGHVYKSFRTLCESIRG
jgi:hypothetical protein